MPQALDGARDILMERLAENAALLGELRAFMKAEAFLTSRVVTGQEEKGAKFSDYFDHKEAWHSVPSHRALAMLRASKEEVVSLDIAPDPETGPPRAGQIIATAIGIARYGGMRLRNRPRSRFNLRDVIPFPKTQKGTDLMTDAPGGVSENQLKELHVRTAVLPKPQA